jgi:hypothetical protein
MSKIGVGVGEDFPVDDGKGGGSDPRPEKTEQEEFEEWRRRRAQWRAQKAEWQRQREEWKARRRAFKAKVKAAARESFGEEWENYRDDYSYRRRHHWFPYLGLGLLFPILAILVVIALISAVFKSPFLFLGLLILAVLLISHRRHHHFGRYRDYDFDLRPASGPIVTPPPSQTPPPSPPAVPTSGA